MISTSLRILQINLNRSLPATESALQTAIELKIDLVLVQEPWISTSTTSTSAKDFTTLRSVNHKSFVQILPNHLYLRLWTLVSVLRNSASTILASLASTSLNDLDVLVLDILEGQHRIQIVNIYNESIQRLVLIID